MTHPLQTLAFILFLFSFVLPNGCSTHTTPGAFQFECLIKGLRNERRETVNVKGDRHFVLIFRWDSWVEKICFRKTVSALTDAWISDCVIQTAGLEWSTKLGAQTEAPWIRSLAGLTDSHSGLTGYGTSAVSQRWLTVWQGDKTCTYRTC